MSKTVVIGFPGETGLWLVDIDAGTIAPLEIADDDGPLASMNKYRKAGTSLMNGVDVAVVINGAPEIAGSYHNV